MPLDPALQAEILRLLGVAVSAPYPTSKVKNNDLFEQFVFGILLAAASREGGRISYRHADGSRAAALRFRITPGWIYIDGPRYTHALLTFDGKVPIEAHIGIRLRGASEVEHECDITALFADQAEFSRRNGGSPASKHALIAIECKHLASRTKLDYGRSFIGLARDLSAKNEFFITNSSSKTVQRLIHEQSLKWGHNIRPALPDRIGQLEAEFRAMFRGYMTGKWGSLR